MYSTPLLYDQNTTDTSTTLDMDAVMDSCKHSSPDGPLKPWREKKSGKNASIKLGIVKC